MLLLKMFLLPGMPFFLFLHRKHLSGFRGPVWMLPPHFVAQGLTAPLVPIMLWTDIHAVHFLLFHHYLSGYYVTLKPT